MTGLNPSPRVSADPSSPQSVRRVVVASFVGTAIEWYDFFLYGTAAALVFNRLFFPTLDPLSGLVYSLSGVSVTSDKPCGETVHVFDGRRRYDIELKYSGQDKVKTDDGYSGPAVKCTVTYKQIAGFKPNLNKGKAIPTITAWFATMESTSGGPVKKFVVPVKIMRYSTASPAGATNVRLAGGNGLNSSCATTPVKYQAAAIKRPIERPPMMLRGEARKSLLAKHTKRRTAASAIEMIQRKVPASIGRRDASRSGIAVAPRSVRVALSLARRNGATIPRSVMYAVMPTNMTTTKERILP